VIQQVSEEPDIKSPLLCQVWFKLNVTLPHLQTWISMVHFRVYLSWTAPEKKMRV